MWHLIHKCVYEDAEIHTVLPTVDWCDLAVSFSWPALLQRIARHTPRGWETSWASGGVQDVVVERIFKNSSNYLYY